MKLKGKEKYFWERNFNIKRIDAIPSVIDGITGIDSDHDDQFFYYLTAYVKSAHHVHLRCTFLTDEGVKYICRLEHLKELTLKDHRGITKDCLPDINKLVELEYLDISKNNIVPEDLLQLDNLKQLKQLHISSEKTGDDLQQELAMLAAHFPGCQVTYY